jgi:phospholipid/cholesterol/gamma-HCH transport system substrate-binding protein
MSGPVERERRLIVRAGLFVAGGLGLAGVVIFLIGKEGRLFERHLPYNAAFENVEGLKLDSPVRLGGLDVGRIKAITFSPDLGDKRIQVTMEISSRFTERLRADSVARVGSRGVLGDKVIDISLGSAEAPKIPEGGEIPTGSSGDITSLLKAGGELVDNAVAISRDLRKGVAAYTEPALRDDLAQVAKSLRGLLKGIETGDGALHALIYDADTKREAKRFLAAAARDAERLDGAIWQAEQILRDAREGKGTLHALLYEKDAARAFSEVGDAAGELAILLRDSRKSPNSAIHQLVYGDAKGLFANLGGAAADLKSITASIRAGDGTIGALVNDPTVYEDLKTILGNVKRNVILRELVRYSISHRGEVEGVGKPEAEKK